MEENNKKPAWELKSHSYQIADTGDYDGHYEITNGKISFFSKDDSEEVLQPIVDALNNSEAKLFLDDAVEFECHILKEENSRLLNELLSIKEHLLAFNLPLPPEKHGDHLQSECGNFRNDVCDCPRDGWCHYEEMIAGTFSK